MKNQTTLGFGLSSLSRQVAHTVGPTRHQALLFLSRGTGQRAGARCYVNREEDPYPDVIGQDQADLDVKLQIKNDSGQVAEISEGAFGWPKPMLRQRRRHRRSNPGSSRSLPARQRRCRSSSSQAASTVAATPLLWRWQIVWTWQARPSRSARSALGRGALNCRRSGYIPETRRGARNLTRRHGQGEGAGRSQFSPLRGNRKEGPRVQRLRCRRGCLPRSYTLNDSTPHIRVVVAVIEQEGRYLITSAGPPSCWPVCGNSRVAGLRQRD